MQLQRTYDNWDAVKDASGTPSSRKRQVWREVLQTRPAIMYWGDSWFSTPLYKNLYWNSFARITGISLRQGGPGLTAAKLLTPTACRDQAERLKSREFDLVCLSIGGNDALADRLQAIFAGAGRMDATQAFERLVDAGTFDTLRKRYANALNTLGTVGGNFRVVGHGYAPLQKIGEAGATSIKNLGLLSPLIGNVGPWLWPPMKDVLGSKDEAKRFADLLLVRGFRDQVLIPSRDAFSGLFSFADFSAVTEATDPTFWYDEIHPTEAGFGVLSAHFNTAIRAALPAAKRAAVG
ncbi:hypothetical protein SAMN05428989_1400 [Pseudoxanthomonas sp. GM95]|uniref:hypothetical protein n=1 Tax=Pseudoxanthomonas sp. GM95 TaxID=1881043 RepID=UPI0008C7E6D5|nr:hypothetical protein [Pseudoxanthomonas sp. GM95]SEL08735.1 hypothetical protein SAMN05428989_1400 [Pseudoxanthomonas sp. GM95]